MITTPRAKLSELSLFRLFSLGDDLPFNHFDENKPFKYWQDPSPVAVTEIPGIGQLAKYSSYRINVLSNQPEQFDFFLPLEQARTTNIPPARWTGLSTRKYTEVPIPCRVLEQGESLRIVPFEGLIVVNDKMLAELEAQTITSVGSFTSGDRALLTKMFDLFTSGSFNSTPPVDYTEQLNRIENMLSQIQIKLSITRA